MKVITYEWRLREIMATAGIYKTATLIGALEERGVRMSSSQVYRLVTDAPERLNLHVLVALMDILQCSADDLIRPVQLGEAAQSTGTGGAPADRASDILRSSGLRPKRAQIVPLGDDA